MFALGNVEEYPTEIVVRSRHSGGRKSRETSIVGSSSVSAPDFKKIAFEVPLGIGKRFRDVKFKTLVGVSPLIPCAWYAVDDCLFVWRFRDGVESTIQCDGVITAVAIGVPSPFVFDPCVKFLVVVATEESVSLHGLDADLKTVKLIGGTGGFFLPVPNRGISSFTQAAVTGTGRVFLWSCSDPASLTEMRYSAKPSWFRSRLSFVTHSLLLTSGGSGIVASVFSKLLNAVFAPRVVGKPTGETVRIYMQSDSTFRFFVTIDSLNLSLHEITPSPTCGEMSTGSWRHGPDTDVTIRVVGRISLSDLAGAGTATPRVLNASVSVDLATNEPAVSVVTDSGDGITLNNSATGLLIITKSRSHATGSFDASFQKRQRTSVGSLQQGAASIASVGAECGGLLITGTGTRISVSSTDGCSDFEANGSVLGVCAERPVESDAYSSFVLPPAAGANQTILVLTGKGVTVLEPSAESALKTVGGTIPVPMSPKTVQEIVAILSSKDPKLMFTYRPMFIRAISDDVAVASLTEEADYANRERAVRPLAGGIWIGGVQKIAETLMLVLKREPVFVSTCRVGPSKLVLESVSNQARNLIKFVRQVIAASGSRSETNAKSTYATGYKRREFMQSMVREQVAKQQAIYTLGMITDELSTFSEIVGFFAVLAEYPLTSLDMQLTQQALEEQWSVQKFNQHRNVLKSICEQLIRSNTNNIVPMIEKLRLVCPSILCTVSPAVVPFNAEGIAAMIHCAVAQQSPVQVLLEAVRMLGRNNPSVTTTLNEITQIVRSLPAEDIESRECVIAAALDGLQERLIDESTVVGIISWAGATLSAQLNEYILDYLFSHGNTEHVAAAAATNSSVERYLVSRLAKAGAARTLTEVYANVLERSGRSQQAGDLLERAAFAHSALKLQERIDLLSRAQQVYPSRKRHELVSIAQHIQQPLLERSDLRELNSTLLGIADLHELAREQEEHDLVLTCYLFVTVKDSELVKAWTNVLFAHLNVAGVMQFMAHLYKLSEDIDSYSIWKKPEIVTALVEYLFCMTGTSVFVPEAFLVNILRMSPQGVVETYVKIIRELNIWSAEIPRVRGATDLVPPSTEILRSYLVEAVVKFASQFKAAMVPQKLQSLMILINTYVQGGEEGLTQLIEELGRSGNGEQHASLPASGW